MAGCDEPSGTIHCFLIYFSHVPFSSPSVAVKGKADQYHLRCVYQGSLSIGKVLSESSPVVCVPLRIDNLTMQ